MEKKEFDLYKDINERTNGEIYIGVVGPVRTGKSTFIKKFMELCVLPHMKGDYDRNRTIDEMPQSASGSTIMTTEPKFIPKDAAEINIEDNCVKVRLVDCVGFAVEGASGYLEGDKSRMVNTPWFEEDITFEDAASIGTVKVIEEHSTIAVMVTTDGSFGSIERKSYEKAEEKTVETLKASDKPFVIILNSTQPDGPQTRTLAAQLQEKYSARVVALNCNKMQYADARGLLESILYEFGMKQINFMIPKWVQMLDKGNHIKASLMELAGDILSKVDKMRDLKDENILSAGDNDIVSGISIINMDMAKGEACIRFDVREKYYYENISQLSGVEISGEEELISLIVNLTRSRSEYEKVKDALLSVGQKGYGVVMPNLADISMEDPVLISHGSKFGVKMNAVSPSIHMIRANIETEIAPIVGNKEQAEDLIHYISESKKDGEGIWNTNIFGKSIGELMEDGIRTKIQQMDDECQIKLQDTMQKIVNDSKGGMICIII